MDNKKFEQLIDLIINEDEDKARALFHDIVVEKSREIYESMMDEEMVDSPVEGLMGQIQAEEEGMTEEEDEFADIEMDDGEGDMDVDLDSDDMGDGEMGEEDLEDRVVDLEDKLDQLMAEFEDLMGQEGGEEHGDMGGDDMGGDDMGGDEMMESADDEDEEEVTEAEEDDEEEETLEEAVQLQKVSVTHGDNGVQTKSPTLGANKKVSSNGAGAVNFSSGDGGKGGTQGGLLNPATKDLKGAGSFKNAPGKGNFSEKGEAAPKPKHGDDGQNTKSITSESRKIVKKPITKPVAQATKKIVKK
jgi:hypothetical protein